MRYSLAVLLTIAGLAIVPSAQPQFSSKAPPQAFEGSASPGHVVDNAAPARGQPSPETLTQIPGIEPVKASSELISCSSPGTTTRRRWSRPRRGTLLVCWFHGLGAHGRRRADPRRALEPLQGQMVRAVHDGRCARIPRDQPGALHRSQGAPVLLLAAHHRAPLGNGADEIPHLDRLPAGRRALRRGRFRTTSSSRRRTSPPRPRAFVDAALPAPARSYCRRCQAGGACRRRALSRMGWFTRTHPLELPSGRLLVPMHPTDTRSGSWPSATTAA